MLSKELVEQYSSLKAEILEIKKELKKCEQTLEQLSNEKVVDKVKGGYGGIQNFKIEGFPNKEYSRMKKIYANKVHRLNSKAVEIEELAETIEEFIDKLEDSMDRRIFKKVILEGKTQLRVAQELHIDQTNISRRIKKYF